MVVVVPAVAGPAEDHDVGRRFLSEALVGAVMDLDSSVCVASSEQALPARRRAVARVWRHSGDHRYSPVGHRPQLGEPIDRGHLGQRSLGRLAQRQPAPRRPAIVRQQAVALQTGQRPVQPVVDEPVELVGRGVRRRSLEFARDEPSVGQRSVTNRAGCDSPPRAAARRAWPGALRRRSLRSR